MTNERVGGGGVSNVISVSGGKDSTALALLAIERGAENLTFAYADTGHEHPQTVEYIGYLDALLRIHAGKSELREIARRFPEELQRVSEWESLVSQSSKPGNAYFFGAGKTPGHVPGTTALDPKAAYGIETVTQWAFTGRGGRQYDLLSVAGGMPRCSSQYGLCE